MVFECILHFLWYIRTNTILLYQLFIKNNTSKSEWQKRDLTFAKNLFCWKYLWCNSNLRYKGEELLIISDPLFKSPEAKHGSIPRAWMRTLRLHGKETDSLTHENNYPHTRAKVKRLDINFYTWWFMVDIDWCSINCTFIVVLINWAILKLIWTAYCTGAINGRGFYSKFFWAYALFWVLSKFVHTSKVRIDKLW